MGSLQMEKYVTEREQGWLTDILLEELSVLQAKIGLFQGELGYIIGIS